MKTEFISSISHELRTPLGFITGYVTTLLRSDLSHSEETRQEFLQIIKEESDKLRDLVEDLLNTSRIQAGSFAVDKGPMDIVDLTRQVVEKMQPIAAGHSFVQNFEPALSAVLGDPRRLEQVLQNLLSNAVKFSSADACITITGRLTGEQVEMSIADQGRGIPGTELGRIFDAFYRAPGGAGQQSGRAGLGLTICKAIIEAHDGDIWVERVRPVRAASSISHCLFRRIPHDQSADTGSR